MKKLLMATLVIVMMLSSGVVFADDAKNEAGLGLDVVLFEQGDETSSNLNDATWLKSVNVEYRCDLNNQPEHKVYVVGKIKLWNK